MPAAGTLSQTKACQIKIIFKSNARLWHFEPDQGMSYQDILQKQCLPLAL